MAPGIVEPLPTAELETIPAKTYPSHSLFHHTLITPDPDAFKFHASASLQLRFGPHTPALSDDRLIVSPYNDQAHLLDLRRLDRPNQLLAKALTILQPIRPDYATAPYTESFNWTAVFDFLRTLSQVEGYRWTQQDFYVVVFRSVLNADADPERLHALDAHSHQEATASGGLLKYWFGTKDEERRNLATCIWRSREDARLGGTGPWHKRARGAARELYERIEFTTLKLVVGEDAGTWSIAEWEEA
ncbi:hypothetical protein BO94DRAFT_469342 [Aspergillus sclerotioniger CBS 115572]|uniref:Uncharacterized protein n=1 Tax=Aspergillus sclerotioniger CBS 115572 TaxID=1450535 RepID=A0A317W9Z0_9EURO|nr:hypothetical protein BO94DRAFT_469342 [Aspergillus sclerotioniger CBS 115572]PWY83183.1 hypothetical protein BO94DRAFT_469342 [Aspergillus sclerotioniger CBS 115572]